MTVYAVSHSAGATWVALADRTWPDPEHPPQTTRTATVPPPPAYRTIPPLPPQSGQGSQAGGAACPKRSGGVSLPIMLIQTLAILSKHPCGFPGWPRGYFDRLPGISLP